MTSRVIENRTSNVWKCAYILLWLPEEIRWYERGSCWQKRAIN